MNIRRLVLCSITAALCLVNITGSHGKPPGAGKDEKKPSATPTPKIADSAANTTLLKWLLQQNGGPDAAVISWSEILRADVGKQVIPLDPADADAAATVAKIGAATDKILPQLNRPDGALRTSSPLTADEVTARVTDELRTALQIGADATLHHAIGVLAGEPAYPAFRLSSVPNGKTYFLAVTLYPTGQRESALRALTFRAAESAARIPADGCCLLVALEHNGKSGHELAFLNWELIDLAKVSLLCSVVFDADQNALHSPGAAVTDGRKGRD